MSVPSLLLRVLMCVVLIASGIGLAQASTRMQLAHAGEAAHVAGDIGASRACHSRMAMASHAGAPVDHGAMGHPAPGQQLDEATGDEGQAGPADCCEGTTCQCACIQHLSAGFSADLLPVAAQLRSGPLADGTSQHIPPRLPHLLRPPIG